MIDQPLHASCVAVGEDAVLIKGAAGSGKSTLALQLMAFGAKLIADDRVSLADTPRGVRATCPSPISGMIEARGVGVLNADSQETGLVRLVVDLDRVETERIPPKRAFTLLGRDVPLFLKVDGIHLAPAILQWLRAGRSDR